MIFCDQGKFIYNKLRFDIKDTFTVSNSNINFLKNNKSETPKDKNGGKKLLYIFLN